MQDGAQGSVFEGIRNCGGSDIDGCQNLVELPCLRLHNLILNY